MSQQGVLDFFMALRDRPSLLARYNQRNLARLLFHARNDGFDFTAAELAELAGRLEASVIMTKDGDPFDGSSRLWRQMWGRFHLGYLVDHVVKRHTDDELRAIALQSAPRAAG